MQPLQTPYASAEWLRAKKKLVSPFGARVAAVLSVLYKGVDNMPRSALSADFSQDHSVAIRIDAGFSTGDPDERGGLTALVGLAHDAKIDIEMFGGSARHLILIFKPGGRKNAPPSVSVEDALVTLREHYTIP